MAQSASSSGPGPDRAWYRDAIVYQIEVGAFCDANGDGLGDLRGLEAKLDYIEYLGFTCLAILPLFPSPWQYHGFDVSDFLEIHPAYGTLRDFQQVLRSAHKRSLRVLLHLPVLHTSSQHPWFQRARRSPEGSRHRDFYLWSRDGGRFEEVPLPSAPDEQNGWSWDPVAGAYYWHRFFTCEPTLNWEHEPVVDAMQGVLDFWLDLGIDGLILEGAPYLGMKTDAGTPDPARAGEILQRLRKGAGRTHPDQVLISGSPAYGAAPFQPLPETRAGCHMMMERALPAAFILALHHEDSQSLLDMLLQRETDPECHSLFCLRDHDVLHIENSQELQYLHRRLGGDGGRPPVNGYCRRLTPLLENDRARVKVAFSILLSLPGVPLIYYGDEIGMGDNVYLPKLNAVRTPMQWTSDRNAGFSQAVPNRVYVPPVTDPAYSYAAVNVEGAYSDPSSLLNWLIDMIQIRRKSLCLTRGTAEYLVPENQRVLAFARRYLDEIVLCVFNLSRLPQTVSLDLKEFAGDRIPIELSGNNEFPVITAAPYVLTLPGHSFYWFDLQRLAADDPRRRRYYSCFISYSSKDEEFVKRLHTDLVSHGVRCWFAPKDLRTGDRFRERIKKSIREYDKLLLVLSANSMRSDWVETEVETAMDKESRHNRNLPPDGERTAVLFPVRLDDEILVRRPAWADDLVLTRHIADFTGWQQKATYAVSLGRLLDALALE